MGRMDYVDWKEASDDCESAADVQPEKKCSRCGGLGVNDPYGFAIDVCECVNPSPENPDQR
jgi:hypothetical protein